MEPTGDSASGTLVSRGNEGWKTGWLLWLAFWVLALVVQWRGGAWESDFGGHSDEGAHVVTGLMARDYLAGGFLSEWNPLAYARDYYERFPKVAIGHYPPLFYAVEGIWLLPFRSPGAVLSLMAALAASGGWLTWRLARERQFGRALPMVLGAVFCLLPLVVTHTALVMSDLLLVILTGLSARSFGRFVETGEARHSWAFGWWAAAAILTKGSGLMLALVPPLTVALTGRWALLKRPALWCGAVPVLLLGLPWMLATRHITAEGMSAMPFGEYLAGALGYYPKAAWREFGPLGAMAIVAAAGWMLWRRFRGGAGAVDAGEAALWSVVLGLPIFYFAVPSGFDERYLLPMVPAVLILVADWTQKIKDHPAISVGLTLVIFATAWRPVEKRHTGADAALALISGEARVLVIANTASEGALTAAAAFQAPERLRISRGTKTLAGSDWLGRDYALKFADPAGLQALFRKDDIDFAVIELPPDDWRKLMPEHQRLLIEWMATQPWGKEIGRVECRRKFGRKGEFVVLSVDQGPGGD
jgi:hypothetical protein